jgi:hypothetical protein
MIFPRSVVSHLLQRSLWILIISGLIASLNESFVTGGTDSVLRDKFLWPFSSTSPWNMPIGSKARYARVNIKPAPRFRVDLEYFYQLKASDPLRPVFGPSSWTKRCSGKKSMHISLPVPDDLIIPDARKGYTPNNAAAFLLPDGKTLVQLEPLARCEKGGPVYGWRYFPNIDIYGSGIGGAHFGSGLSSIGGSVRLGELTDDQPIRHTLKVLIWGKKYLYYSKKVPGYRWPADRADGYAAKEYGGKDPQLVQGSLLAILPNINDKSLKLQTIPAKKLFYALQNYGAYIVDDAGWDTHGLAVEKGVLDEFQKKYGYSMHCSNCSFDRDMMKLFSALHVVTNNAPDRVGGGGDLRVPLAPPIGN